MCLRPVLVTRCPPAGPIQSHIPSWPLARCGRRRGAILRCARDSGTSRIDTLPQLVTPPLDNGTYWSFLVLQLHISPSMPFWNLTIVDGADADGTTVTVPTATLSTNKQWIYAHGFLNMFLLKWQNMTNIFWNIIKNNFGKLNTFWLRKQPYKS